MQPRPNLLILLCLHCLLCLACASTPRTEEDLLRLRIGDTPRKNNNISIAVDAIVDTARDEVISPLTLVDQLTSSRLVLIGEQHTGAEFHAVQLHVLELLQAAGVPLLIGMEMFPAASQAVLDRWTDGALEESEFLAESDWYRVWGYHWGYYRELLLFARAHGIRVIGLNARPTSESGTDETATAGANLDSDDHRALLRAFFGADSPVHGDLSSAQFEQLFSAQSRRDATMARHAADALNALASHTMVVLAGTGHVLYGLGIARQLPDSYRRSAVTIVPVPVNDDEAIVSASVADFVWGIPEPPYPAYPELGVLTVQTRDGLHIIYIDPDSPAEAAGLETGDVLTDIGETPLTEKSDLTRAVADTRWGDVVIIGLIRDNERRELAVALRR